MLSKNKKIIKNVTFLRKNYFIIKNIFLMMCLLKNGRSTDYMGNIIKKNILINNKIIKVILKNI